MCDGENESEVWMIMVMVISTVIFLKLKSAQKESFKTTVMKSILKRK